ncbi:amidohydrolase family protein [Luteimonas huabeiensis]|uniref:amidohydrolase family protein n=1 Tax=Luteimonas huabeiensis TaxID=1244513 RepID=UPI0004641471|nr:amidohydrolase family protein [Luteimonas huabeiensis]
MSRLRPRWAAALLGLASAVATAGLPAAAASTAIVGARILPVSSPAIASGTLVIGDDGRIAAVGPADAVAVPAGARRIDGAGLVVYPGLIDSETSLGLAERDMEFAAHDVLESSAPLFPQGRVADAFNPDSAHLEVVRANGITHAVVAPGDSLPATGQSALVRLAADDRGHIVRSPLALHLNVSERVGGTGAPATRMGVAARLRQLLADGRVRLDDARARAKPDPKLDALAPALRGEQPVVISATSSQDVRLALALAREFGLALILSDVLDAEDQFDAIAAAGVPVVLGPIQLLPRQDQRYDAHFRVPAQLAARGIPFAFSSGGVSQIRRFGYPRMAQMRNLPYLAGLATGYGLDPDAALQALTLAPARIWGVDDEMGSLEAGKRAHVVVATGDPLEPTSEVRHVFVDGREVPLDSYQSRLRDRYRAGGRR